LDILKITGERIRSLVLGRGYASIELFAHEHGIPKSTLSELLNGKNDPKLTTLAKICAGLEIPLSDLLADPGIDSWVREVAPGYDPRSPRQKSGKTGGKTGKRPK
jgi:transcriptional regulator with XRE-family HTH domain